MTAMYSLWLMPDEASLAALQPQHEQLCRQFGAPHFDLHLTLLGGRDLDLTALKCLLPEIARGIAPFAVPVLGVRTSEAYFQSFYALFAAEGPVLALKARAMRLAVSEDVGPFMPHVSLLYGPVEAGAKADAARAAQRTLTGRMIRFDAVTIACSSDTVPVGEWRIEAQAGLS